jgi:hypothetical protein
MHWVVSVGRIAHFWMNLSKQNLLQHPALGWILAPKNIPHLQQAIEVADQWNETGGLDCPKGKGTLDPLGIFCLNRGQY